MYISCLWSPPHHPFQEQNPLQLAASNQHITAHVYTLVPRQLWIRTLTVYCMFIWAKQQRRCAGLVLS
jgi:hypothetical protein